MRRPSEAWLTREMSMVFYQLSSRSGMRSPCPLSTFDSLQLHLVGFSGQKAHGGQAVSAPRCVAVPRWVLHKGWERSCSCSYFRWHEPRVLPGTQGNSPAMEGPSMGLTHYSALADRAMLSSSWLAGRALRAPVQPHSPTMVFSFKTGICTAKPNPLLLLCVTEAFCPLKNKA